MDTPTLEKMLEQQMREAAAAMDFELAAQLRDQLFELRARGATPSPASGREGAKTPVGR
jgi:excinuclease UvrABC helicase subunit UvrB